MMWGNGFGMGGGWLLGGLLMLLFWAAVIGLIVWAIWAFSRRQPGRADYSTSPQAPAERAAQGDRALQIAKERYARGEISREQYDEIRQTLGA
ncbi:MAG: SHOCT domain-containing protein [Nitrososphaerales archaeon]